MRLKERENLLPDEPGPVHLAYIGDAVYELMVRESMMGAGHMPIAVLHRAVTGCVKAAAQSKIAGLLEPLLTEEEEAVYRRGRNAKTTVPRSADVLEYHRATGLEALWGYLYLCGRRDRLCELFNAAFGAREDMKKLYFNEIPAEKTED